jgi:SAM-dependent methyltransferase
MMNERAYYSPILFTQYKITLPIIIKWVKGRLIDVGCGDLPYKGIVQKYVDTYDSIDIIPRSNEVTYQSDIHDMSVIPNYAYDSVICLEVFEHIKYPWKAINEINRILKPGGVLILSVPHLSRLHEEPDDYYRYTKYGITALLESGGFNIELIVERGGVFSFVGHQISTVLLHTTDSIPVLNKIAYLINRVFIVRICTIIDNYFMFSKRIPAGYTCVAFKK